MKGSNFSSGFQNVRSEAQMNVGLRNYMVYIYQYMSAALGLSGIVAFLFAQSPQMMALLHSPVGFIIMLAPLGISLMFGFKIQSMELKTAQMLFWAFAALMGASLSSIFLVYTSESICRAFFISAGTFLAMSLYGYTTNKDLTSMGSFMMMGLFGIIIASLVNIFLKSTGLAFVISILSVFIFIGLVAYDTQKIKSMYYNLENSSMDVSMAKKIAIMGALSLYMNFINLFLAILRFVGDRKE